MMIQTLHLTKRYWRGKVKRAALNSVFLSVKTGECCAIVGASGAGKTTLLGLLSTLVQPTWGEVRIAGFVAGYESERIRPLIGLVPEKVTIYPGVSVAEDLAYYALAHGLSGPLARRGSEKVMEELGLREVQNEATENLAAGLRKRLALGRVIMHEPKVLLVDEPYAGLTEEEQTAVMSALQRLHDRGVTVVAGSGVMAGLAGVATHVAFLSGGTLLFKDRLDDWHVVERQHCNCPGWSEFRKAEGVERV